MPVVSAGRSETFNLNAGEIYAINSAGTGNVWLTASGAQDIRLRSLNIGDVANIGPFSNVTVVRIECFTGSVTYTSGQVAFEDFNGATSVAVLGDSIAATASSYNSSTNRVYINDRGFMGWACALSGQAVRFDHSLNFGVAGETIAMVANRVPNVIGSGARMCVMNPGTNDLTAKTPIETMKSGYLQIVNSLLNANIRCLVIPILPRNDTSFNAMTAPEIATARRKRDQFNRWLWELAYSMQGVEFVDVLADFTDFSVSTVDNPLGTLRTALTYDNLHPNARGGFVIGSAIAKIINYIVRPLRYPLSPINAFHASENPNGNLFLNPMLTGTGGTANTGMTGTVATSWVVERNGGSANITGTVSTVNKTLPLGNTYSMQQIVMNNPGAGPESIQFRQNMAISGLYVPGTKRIVGEVDIEVNAPTGLIGAYFDITEANGVSSAVTVTRSMQIMDVTGVGAVSPTLPAVAMSMRHRTAVAQSNSTAVNLWSNIIFLIDPGATVTVRIANPSVWTM